MLTMLQALNPTNPMMEWLDMIEAGEQAQDPQRSGENRTPPRSTLPARCQQFPVQYVTLNHFLVIP